LPSAIFLSLPRSDGELLQQTVIRPFHQYPAVPYVGQHPSAVRSVPFPLCSLHRPRIRGTHLVATHGTEQQPSRVRTWRRVPLQACRYVATRGKKVSKLLVVWRLLYTAHRSVARALSSGGAARAAPPLFRLSPILIARRRPRSAGRGGYLHSARSEVSPVKRYLLKEAAAAYCYAS
jgi:hypothetical protein